MSFWNVDFYNWACPCKGIMEAITHKTFQTDISSKAVWKFQAKRIPALNHVDLVSLYPSCLLVIKDKVSVMKTPVKKECPAGMQYFLSNIF